MGCLTCVSVDCTWKVSCLTCNTTGNFTASKTSCGKTQYSCNCPNNLFPDYKNLNCSTCASIIPNCKSCATNQYIGTYCSSCDVGYFRVYVWYDNGKYYSNLNASWSNCQNCNWNNWANNYARSCASCPVGCSGCWSSTSCFSCFNNMQPTNNGGCTCNSSNSLFYNTATQSCTSCSAAISGCLSCTLSGTTTKCTSCSKGYYLNTTTSLCVVCPTYCTTCSSTTCLTCTSTFTQPSPLTYCICNSPLFLKTSPTPATC